MYGSKTFNISDIHFNYKFGIFNILKKFDLVPCGILKLAFILPSVGAELLCSYNNVIDNH